MGDGDEAINLSPSFFCFECPRAWRPLSLLLAPARSLHPDIMSFSPSCLSSVWACGGAWSVVPLCGAVLLTARRSFPVSGGLAAACVPRLGAQCGRRVACHAWFVPVNRRGRRDGSLAALCLLG